jgi:hypothetical protein
MKMLKIIWNMATVCAETLIYRGNARQWPSLSDQWIAQTGLGQRKMFGTALIWPICPCRQNQVSVVGSLWMTAILQGTK